MKKVQKTLLLCTVISVCSGLMKATSLYDEVWRRVRQTVYLRARWDVRLNEELRTKGRETVSMYKFYMLGFIRKHTIPFKNYKSKDLIAKLEKYLDEIEDRNKSSGNNMQCPTLFGGKECRKFMLQIIEEFLLERLLFWRDYKQATGLMLEYPCERLCAPFIVYFYRMRAELKWEEWFEPNDAQRFKQIFDKRLKKFKQMRLGILHMRKKNGFIADTAEKVCEVLFGGEDAYERLKNVMSEIEIFIEEAINSVHYLDCNYWKPEPIGEEEGRKILEEIE